MNLKSIQIASTLKDRVWQILHDRKAQKHGVNTDVIGFDGHFIVGTQDAVDTFCSILSGKYKRGQGKVYEPNA